VLRDPDGYTYVKEEVGGLVVGGFEPSQAVGGPGPDPQPFEFPAAARDWDHFSVLMDSALTRLPVAAGDRIKKFYNGPESFTPDNQFILGEAPGLRNFFVAAGFNSVGIASAGGAGLALAQWITDGQPDTDLTTVDIRRFAAFNGNTHWLREPGRRVLGLHYAVPWPNRELETARPFRRSPVYHLLREANACFGSKMGWERAKLLRAGRAGAADRVRLGQAELAAVVVGRAARHPDGGGRVRPDLVLQVPGHRPDAEVALQWLCTNDVAVAPGRTVYTGLLNDRGTYESDLTVTPAVAAGVPVVGQRGHDRAG